MKKSWIIIGLIGLGLVGYRVMNAGGAGVKAGSAGVPTAGAHRGVEAGDRAPAPDFRLEDLSGNWVELSKSKGKVVLVDFWATWCPPCRAEIPHFNELYAQYRSKGLEIIGVSLDEGGFKVVRPFASANGMKYPVVMGDSELTRAYGGIRGIPTTFLIDKRGNIAHKYVGYQEKQVFEEAIQALLGES